MAAAPGVAAADDPPDTEPTQVTPEQIGGKERRAARRDRDDSNGGTDDGTFEFVLGALVAVVTGVVIGRGVWELTQIEQTRRDCANGASDFACASANQGRGNRIAAGLSFGVAVPMSVATGFLFARAVRTRRDYRAWHAEHPQVSLSAAAGRRGAGLGLQVRF